ncbi:MAG: hypothetical protein IK097_04925, partial [Clostridia bacterium]|nr:hypothetical protein [Clostridia bacterium]
FKKTKEDIEKAFGNYIKGKLFVPDDYKTHSGENSFRGVYIPHYNYTVGYKPGTVVVEGHRDFDEGNKHHHMTFANEVTTGGGESENIVRDASAAFDDNLAAAIAPYSHSEAAPFREGYLGDFYADIPSVDPGTYDEEVTEEAVDEMKEEIERANNHKDMEFDYDDDKLAARVEKAGVRADLYPVWFMTHKMRNNRVAYAVANGQTGKMAMDLPVSRSKFFIGVSLVTVILFAAFILIFGYMTPGTLTGICSLLLAVSLVVLTVCAFRIHKRESSIISGKSKTDKISSEAAKRKEKIVKKAKNAASFSSIVTIFIMAVYSMSILKAVRIPSMNAAVFLCGAALLIAAGAFIAMLFLIRSDDSLNIILINGISSVLFIAACLVLTVKNPFNDRYYAGAALISQLIVIVNCLSVIGLFDRLCTHPAPDFFTRKGASHDGN